MRLKQRHAVSVSVLLLAVLAGLLVWAQFRDGQDAPASRLDRMIGQMIIVGFHGDTPGDEAVRTAARQIAEGGIGGVMYLRRNVRDERSVKAMNAAFSAANPEHPPLIAVDQEGGEVERLTRGSGFREIPSARDVALSLSTGEAHLLYASLADRLNDWGFNLNFGPVVDIDANPANPIIGGLGRSFSPDPATVAGYGEAFVRAHRQSGVLTALKHFPGHGSSVADSHRMLADVTATWSEAELLPFGTLIDDGHADMVMVGHLYHGGLQKGAAKPASLSPDIVGGLLRGKLGYSGIVVSDDLQMAAVESDYSLEEAVVGAVEAGVDILVFSNFSGSDPGLPARIAAILSAEAARNALVAENIARSYEAIVALKQRWRQARHATAE